MDFNEFSPITIPHSSKQRKFTTRKLWTDEDWQYMDKYYPDTPTEEMAKVMGRSLTSIYTAAKKRGLCKSEAFRKSEHSGGFQKGSNAGKRHRFKKGHIPKNKGKKWSEYMTEKAKAGCRKTQFKKGNLPANTLEDGTITVRKDSKGNKYQWIRLAKAKWEMLHVNIWKKSNGNIPPGHIIVFKDKNPMNCVLENLEMITLAENMKRNTIHNLPPEVKETITALSSLKRIINGKEQNSRPKRSSI